MRAKKRKNIPGIHNYCDRWCERCQFTSVCAVYESTESDTEEEKDLNNQAFWDKLHQNFAKALEMLDNWAREQGLDPEELRKIDEEEEKRMAEQEEELEKHPLLHLARQYSKSVHETLKQEEFWKDKADELTAAVEMELVADEQIKNEVYRIKDSQEVITWYMYFIEAKTNRALAGKLDNFYEPGEIQTDFNGSAKIAGIALQRSMAAWADLLSKGLDEDKILPLLSMLSQLSAGLKKEFPDAEKFIRPGFDDVSQGIRQAD